MTRQHKFPVFAVTLVSIVALIIGCPPNPPDGNDGNGGVVVPPQAHLTATLVGANEVPPVTTTATGSFEMEFDEANETFTFRLEAEDIVDVTAAHIHVGAVGVNGPIIIFLFDATTDGPFVSPVTGTRSAADFIAAGGLTSFAQAVEAMVAGDCYVNVHTVVNPGGEIRGQLALVPVTTARRIQVGDIKRLGSIFVNGDEIATDQAQIVFDDQPHPESDLKPGMRVEAEVEVDEATGQMRATRVKFDDDLFGPIDAPDLVTLRQQLATGELSVMGQTVKLDSLTAFQNAGLADLAPGNILQISGLRDAAGALHARFVDRRGVGFDDLPEIEQELEVKGMIENLDAAAQTFTVGDLLVDFGTATLDAAITAAGGLANGMMVEVRSGQNLAVDGTLVAASISMEDNPLDEDAGVEVRVEGLVTAVTSATQFEVNGHPAITNAQTLFKRGAAADIALGRLVEVEGVLDANGVLVAREVSFELAKVVKIEGATVESVSATGVTALGISVTVDANTMFEDKSSAEIDAFALADLGVGDTVDIRAFIDTATGAVVAAKLERQDPRTDGRIRLQGPASAASGNTVTILGMSFDLSAIAANQFRDVAGNQVTLTEFLALAAQAGNLVKLRGTMAVGGAITWERAEIEVEHEFEHEVENEFEFEFEDEFEDESGDDSGGA